jgi:NAD(P)-dependent dehydrogenase (short-subunit alcohol dehydrogenase family)
VGETISFEGQVVLVSGAGRGIGRAHALLLAERGAHVIVNDIDPDVADSVVAEITATGARATAAPGDVVDDADDIVGVALDAGGRLDALVNNAGIVRDKAFGSDAVEEMQRLLRVHALGTVALTVSAWSGLVASRGRIVNTTSGAVIGLRHATAYAAAKGAILGFTRSLALEAVDVGIRVNAVMPMARTRMYEQAGGEVGSAEDQSDAVPYNGKVIESSGATTAYVEFGTTPYLPARTPEEVRDSLASSPGELSVVDQLSDMVAAKLSM